ncbi:MAG TPA: ABC transporter C-terminal domain-containing protein, partial [Parvibaculum sp.]
YPGGYSDWLRFTRDRAAPRAAAKAAATGEAKTAAAPRVATKLSYKESRLLEELGVKMPKLQGDIARLEAQLADPGFYTRNPNEFAKVTARHHALRTELEAAEEQWLELEMKREALTER